MKFNTAKFNIWVSPTISILILLATALDANAQQAAHQPANQPVQRSITQLTVRVDTSDIDVDGDDNDFFERIADLFADDVIRLAAHGPDIDDRDFFAPSSVHFGIYDASL